MNLKKHIPNAITSGNLICGCLAIVFAFQDQLVWSAYMVGLAAVLDFFDGFAARMLHVHSDIGKQLDSLADMVTFGVVPGMVMFQLMKGSFFITVIHNLMDLFRDEPNKITSIFPQWTIFLAFLIPVFSALRLAKFNIDTRQSDSFIGVPTPANAMLICSLPLILEFQPEFMGMHIQNIILNPWFLISLTLLMSYLLVAELPLFALKIKHFKWAGNEIRYIFLALCLILLIIFKYGGIPIIIFLYVLLSIINTIQTKKKNEVQG